jgi:ribonuclease Y
MEQKKLAKKIADKIHEDLNYPGEIKVVVIRENRIIEHAK